jgi:hypothetical protein
MSTIATTAPKQELLESEYEVSTADALRALQSGEIDSQIATANKYPRSITQFSQDIITHATLTPEVAGSMYYRLPRGKDDSGKTKFIEGASIRMAEVAASSYRNLRFGSRIISVDEKFITAYAFCHDLEKNIACAVEVRRRITYSDKGGRPGARYNDDMIGVTGAAAAAIALRNAIFKVIPLAYIHPALEQAKETFLGKNRPISERRKSAMEYWLKAGATEAEIFHALGIKGIEDMGNEELLSLIGMYQAIKAGELTFEAAIKGPREDTTTGKTAKSDVNAKLKGATDEDWKAEVLRKEAAEAAAEKAKR